MDVTLSPPWNAIISKEFKQEYFAELINFVDFEYNNGTCYPRGEQIFSAFNMTPFDKVKVIIIGQDPYHGEGQANGLSFSVPDGITKPPSLVNIFKELKSDLNVDIPDSGNLEYWARQGVFLLNATLTVRAGQAGSHQNKGWEHFTDAVISYLSNRNKGLVFLLWGGKAQKKGAKIDQSKHLVLSCGHPSPLSANKGHWFGNKHFSKTNQYLEKNGKEPINWVHV